MWISKSTLYIKIHAHLNILKETSICITKYVLLFFPNYKQNAAIFPNSKGPSPKKGVLELCNKIFMPLA